MVAASESFRLLRQILRERPTRDEIDAIIEKLMADNNAHAIALTCPALVDAALEDALVRRLILPTKTDYREMFEGDALLATFSAKIRFAFALGIIGSKTRKDLNCVRAVRNAFAHAQKPLQFDEPAISEICDRITAQQRDNPDARPFGAAVAKFIFAAFIYTAALHDIHYFLPGNKMHNHFTALLAQ
jgi:DNA-binding MltR family transcriptional regulator